MAVSSVKCSIDIMARIVEAVIEDVVNGSEKHLAMAKGNLFVTPVFFAVCNVTGEKVTRYNTLTLFVLEGASRTHIHSAPHKTEPTHPMRSVMLQYS